MRIINKGLWQNGRACYVFQSEPNVALARQPHTISIKSEPH